MIYKDLLYSYKLGFRETLYDSYLALKHMGLYEHSKVDRLEELEKLQAVIQEWIKVESIDENPKN